MSFEIFTSVTNQPVVRIKDNEVWVHPLFAKPLERIRTSACFVVPRQEDKEKEFGDAKMIKKGDPLYPKALKMYCQAKMLTHPESYTDKPKKPESSPPETLNPLNKV